MKAFIQNYNLALALTVNTTGVKYDAIALPILLPEIKMHKVHFTFDFAVKFKEGYTVYKLCKSGEPDIIQGLVAFRSSPGVLECSNMETAIHNRGKTALYNGLGKAMLALCCKVSIDNDMDGYIAFDSKGRLRNYYSRYGAISINAIRMYLDTAAAQQLIKMYF